jgi:hypothetical protein
MRPADLNCPSAPVPTLGPLASGPGGGSSFPSGLRRSIDKMLSISASRFLCSAPATPHGGQREPRDGISATPDRILGGGEFW